MAYGYSPYSSVEQAPACTEPTLRSRGIVGEASASDALRALGLGFRAKGLGFRVWFRAYRV